MSKTGNNTQGQKPKTYGLAKLSLGLGIIGVCLFFTGILLPIGLATLVYAFVLGIVALVQIKTSRGLKLGGGFAIAAISISSAILVLYMFGGIFLGYVKADAIRIFCGKNLTQLGKAMLIYSEDFAGKYPTPDEWCDVLLEHNYIGKGSYLLECPGARKRGKYSRCHYAINPNCEPNSLPDMVLLFETEGGWNQFGGPEMLSTANHRPRGCNILFNNGRVNFVKPKRLGELKWEIEEEEEGESRNVRRPDNKKEVRYWLENMVWYHRFTNEEISAATALTEKAIVAALKRFDIRPDNRPRRTKDAPLLVLPYPGGRHPRIGFLDGAIDPQRETKFSVFTPWDANSYVVVDVPEAIWSNLGLTYLAHTHIDTIWTKQGIEMSPLEWNRRADGTLDIERRLPNGIAFGVKVKPTTKAVRMEMWLKNGTDKPLTGLRVQNCVMTKMAAGFEQQTNDNKVFTNPYVACRSSDGKRWIITAWEGCDRPWGNQRCPCFHSDPKFPDTEPGQMHRLRGWLSFYEGTDIEAEFKRIEATGWRKP